MHCDSEQRAFDLFLRLKGDSNYRRTAYRLLSTEFALSRDQFDEKLDSIVEMVLDNPYPNLNGRRPGQTNNAEQQVWLDTLVQTCRDRDSEFTPALEDVLVMRIGWAISTGF